jgi:very-short-patch-repair endonuclease
MLQKNGYFVLRFLAEDAGKRLSEILDTILAGLARSQEPGARSQEPGARSTALGERMKI